MAVAQKMENKFCVNGLGEKRKKEQTEKREKG